MTNDFVHILARAEQLCASEQYLEADTLLAAILPVPTPIVASEVAEAIEHRLLCMNHLANWDEMLELTGAWLSIIPADSLQYRLRTRLHSNRGIALSYTGDIQAGEDHLRAAIHLSVWNLEDKNEELRCRRLLTLLFKNQGRWKQAYFEGERGLDIADATGNGIESGAIRIVLATLLMKSGTLEDVAGFLDKAETALEAAGRWNWLSLAHLLRAKYLRMTGHPAKALALLEPVLGTTRENKYVREEAICLEYMGDCHLARRDYKTALGLYNSALEIANSIAPKGDIIPELGHRIGECLVQLGDPNGAILSCERGLRVARDIHDRYEECATHRVLAMAHRAAGNPTKALRLATEGASLGRSYEIPYELARVLAWLGETRLQSHGRDDQMMGRLQLWEARAIFERIGLANEAQTLDRLLGFEDEGVPEIATPEAGLGAIAGVNSLDRGALRFGIVTSSDEVSQAVATIQSVAPSRIPVLITGPSGVGKELLARALHQMSDRRKQPFIAVNCGALAPGILDSELFGHERGAFTGAVNTREGLFVAANRGTLFLDEIGELSLAAQATLLRVLENGELRPMGGDEVRTIDVRIVAATNADLESRVDRGTFRRDLYYRLEGVAVRIPPLAEREEDIRCLFRYFFAQAATASGKRLGVGEDVEAKLCAYAWPGNVRELKNEIGRAVAMAETGAVLGRDAFLPKLKAKTPASLRQARERVGADADERQRILEALRAHQGNKADAARSLGGMKRTTLLYKIERLGIQPEEYEVNEA